MKKKGMWINVIITLIMSVAMGLVAAIVIFIDPKTQTPALPVFCLINIVESIVVGFAVAFLIPLGKLGHKLASRAGAAAPSMKFHLLNAIPLAIGNSLIIGGVLSFVNVAQAHARIPADQAPPLLAMWMGSFLPLFIPSVVISYVLAILVAPIVVKLIMGSDRGEQK